jgi:hypothetical protein
LVQITKAIGALMSDLKDGLKGFEPADEMKSLEKLDALEVIKDILVYSFIYLFLIIIIIFK